MSGRSASPGRAPLRGEKSLAEILPLLRQARRPGDPRTGLPDPTGSIGSGGEAQGEAAAATGDWSLAELSGRLCELCGDGADAALTLAFRLVLDAQQRGEPAAWIMGAHSSFFPPDAAEGGVDLDALLVVRTSPAGPTKPTKPTKNDRAASPTRNDRAASSTGNAANEGVAVARAADQLARSGAFGLLVLDLGGAPPSTETQEISEAAQASAASSAPAQAPPSVPMPLLSRLLGLAQKHQIAIVFLTRAERHSSSLGSLISLRGEARRRARPERQGGGFVCELQVVKDKRRALGWTYLEVCHGPAGLR